MVRLDTSIGDAMLRLAGAGLLAVAWLIGRPLATLGLGHGGHEPAIVYLLAALTFWSASTGLALVTRGRRLFARVIVAERWLPHVPMTFGQVASGRSVL